MTLGLDQAGRIVAHDEPSAYPLTEAGELLLGTAFTHLITDPFQAAQFEEHLESARLLEEASTVLTLRTVQGGQAAATVTLTPVRSSTDLQLRVVVRFARPAEGRFGDRRIMYQALLGAPISRAEEELDIDAAAPRLTRIVVPHFCNTSGLLIRESLIADAGLPATPADGSLLLRRITMEPDDRDPRWQQGFPLGELLPYASDSLYARCLETREPVIESYVRPEQGPHIARAWGQRPAVAELLTGTSILFLPLIAHREVLGVMVCIRKPGYRRFDVGDVQIGREFAARAAAVIDNARRYRRERATALALQHSLLPAELSGPPGVEVRHRYLPGSRFVEVGGDWYESVALPGGRVALAIGDVAGHGISAAVTMGRLRSAFHTLVKLELSPAEVLQQLNELVHELTHEPQFATCACAVYDPVTGSCELAPAGHLPPLLVAAGSPPQYFDLPTAPPLGVSTGLIEERAIDLPDGSLLVLYTDGLLKTYARDMDGGLARLREVFAGQPLAPLDELCQAAVADVETQQQRDDIAVLVARLRRLPPGRHVSWTLPGEWPSVEQARSQVSPALHAWGLAPLIPAAELIVSELAANAIEHAHSPIELRLLLADGLYCEVHDDSAALPGLRNLRQDGGRGGLRAVSQVASRWGSRRTPSGKVVWCYLPVPPDSLPRR